MIVNALAGKPLPVYGDGMNVRDWLYVADHCSAIRTVLARGRPGETYNVGGSAEMTNIDVVQAIWPIRARASSAARLRAAGHVRQGSAGTRSSLCDRRREDPARARMEARRDVRIGDAEDGRLVSRERRLARERAERGIPAMGGHAVCVITKSQRKSPDDAQGHHSRGRVRHASVSGDAGRVEAAAAGLRQADDLLPAVDADARRHPGHPAHLDAGGHAALRTAPGRRRAMGPRDFLCGAALAGRPRAGVHHRRASSSDAMPRRSCSATTSSTGTTCSRNSSGRRARCVGRDDLRVSGRRSRALRRRRIRRGGPRDEPRGKAAGAEVALRGDGPLLLRQPRARYRRRARAVGARRAGDHRRQSAVPRVGRARRAR